MVGGDQQGQCVQSTSPLSTLMLAIHLFFPLLVRYSVNWCRVPATVVRGGGQPHVECEFLNLRFVGLLAEIVFLLGHFLH